MNASSQRPRLSVIVPCLNEADGIGSTLAALAPLRSRGCEVIVVDGGSTDDTAAIAHAYADAVISSECGRALQMNAGAGAARGGVLLFLHADTVLPESADLMIWGAFERERRVWGRFDVEIQGEHPLLRLIAWAMNLRSRWSGIATGDQAIFTTCEAFRHVGGFPAIRLMEDIALSRSLLSLSRPVCLRARVSTSGRRWIKHGVVRTVCLMWQLRLAYALGAHPDGLAARYAAHK